MNATERWGVRREGADLKLLTILDDAAGMTTAQLAQMAEQCDAMGRGDAGDIFRKLVRLDLERREAAKTLARLQARDGR